LQLRLMAAGEMGGTLPKTAELISLLSRTTITTK
jgi:hypothetical protein